MTLVLSVEKHVGTLEATLLESVGVDAQCVFVEKVS